MGRGTRRYTPLLGREGWISLARLGALLLLAATYPLSEARAAPSRILVLALEAPGFDGALAEQLDAAIREKVEALEPGNGLPKPAMNLDSMKLAAGCPESRVLCLRRLGQLVGADRVLEARLEGTADAAQLILSLVPLSGREKNVRGILRELEPASATEVAHHVGQLFGRSEPLPAGSLVLEAPPGHTLDEATIKLDGQVVTAESLKEVRPGAHRLEIARRGFQTFGWQGWVRPGRMTQVPIALEALPPPAVTQKAPNARPAIDPATAVTPERASSPRVLTWILGGAAVAASGVAVVQGLRVLSIEGELEDVCKDRPAECRVQLCDQDGFRDRCDDGRQAATIATVSWVLVGAFSAGAVAAFFLEGEARDAPPVSVQIAPAPSGGFAGISLNF